MVITRNMRGYKAARARFLQQPRLQIDGFNAKADIAPSFHGKGLSVMRCSEEFPCPVVVSLYAKMGLHRYNLLNGTNLKLIRVLRYNHSIPTAASTYYITMLAHNPHTNQELVFQTKVDEESYGKIVLTCYISTPLGETETNPNYKTGGYFSQQDLPEWPQENPFKQFYLLNESELQQYDWVRFYLELAVATTTRGLSKHDDLSNVNIFEMAIDTMGEGLNAKNATVYIHFNDPCEARVGKDVDRLAIVKRNFDDHTGCFSFKGRNQSSQGIDIMIPQEKGIVIPEEVGQSSQGMIVIPQEMGQSQSLEGMPEEKGQSQSSQGIVMPDEKGQSSDEKSKKKRDGILLLLGVRKVRRLDK